MVYPRLEPFKIHDGPFVDDRPGIERRFGFQQEYLNLLFGYRQMFHATRNDHKFSCIQVDVSLSQLHDQVSAYHQKQFIFLFVMVPDKFTFELDELDMSIVYLTNNFRTPGLGKLGKFFCQAYFFNHATLSFIQLFTWYSWMSYWDDVVCSGGAATSNETPRLSTIRKRRGLAILT